MFDLPGLCLNNSLHAQSIQESEKAKLRISGTMAPSTLFRSGTVLAVVGDEEAGFWLCRLPRPVNKSQKSFDVQWFEQTEDEENHYGLVKQKNHVELKSVVCEVKNLVKDGKTWRLKSTERTMVEDLLVKMDDGEWEPPWENGGMYIFA